MAKRRQYDIFAVWLGSLVFVFLLGVSIAYTFAAPSVAPPGGSGVMSVSANGNVGIGLSVGMLPAQKLDVNGNINAIKLCIAGDCKSSWSASAQDPYYGSAYNVQATNYISKVCPAGRKIISGGCSTNKGCLLQYSRPNSATNAWECGYNPTTGCGATVYIICQ